MRRIPESGPGPENKEGDNISTTYIDLTRHGNRFGGKIKIDYQGKPYEFDDTESITPDGKEATGSFGATYPEEVTLVHPRGGAPRHGETGDDILLGTGGKFGYEWLPDGSDSKSGHWERKTTPAPVLVGGEVKGARKGVGTDYKESGMEMAFLKKIKGIIGEKMQQIFDGLPSEEQEKLLKPENAELRAKYREQAQIVGLEEAMRDEKSVQIAAENEALELMHVMKLSRRGVQGGETKAIPIVGSGMFAESLFKHALVVEDPNSGEKKVGYDDVSEIGGITKQATAFRIKATRDSSKDVDDYDLNHIEDDTTFDYEFTDPEKAKLFEGKKVYLDWNKVRELAKSAEERFRAK